MREARLERPGGAVPSGIETVDVDEPDWIPAEPTGRTGSTGRTDQGGTTAPRLGSWKPPPLPLRVGTNVAVALCLAMALVHVLLVFLYVAPPNPLSRQYSRQVNAWIFPLFEQNWRLFAPDPESVNRQISARTMHTAPDGRVRVSGWLDLSGVDNSAVRHDVFPSHTAQNMLRRAWSSYLETHGGDDRLRSERALMMQKYLTDIAADRITDHRGGAFESVQLRVITIPIAAPAERPGPGSSAAAPKSVETRYLPWWKVTSDGN